MASAPITKPDNGKLPPGYKPEFTLTTQTGSHDDMLAIVSTISGKKLSDVFSTAVTLGMRRFNYYVDETLVRKLLLNLSPWTIGPCREFTTIAALPALCIWLIEYDTESETGRGVIYRHIAAQPNQPSFNYVLDVSNNISDVQRVTTSLSHLNTKSSWYWELTMRPNPNGTKPK
jgi:hypothetical protein